MAGKFTNMQSLEVNILKATIHKAMYKLGDNNTFKKSEQEISV